MSRFNYAREKEEFDREWAILEKQYREAGMPEENIMQMRDYDWTMFGRRRSWANHEIGIMELLPNSDDFSEELDEGNTSLVRELVVTDTYSIVSTTPQLDWLNQINNPDLAEALEKLSATELAILSAYVLEGKRQREIANFYGTSQQDISQKMLRIKNFLKNFLLNL